MKSVRESTRYENMLDVLMGQLREHGLESAEQVKKCYLEPDGKISVIKSSPKR